MKLKIGEVDRGDVAPLAKNAQLAVFPMYTSVEFEKLRQFNDGCADQEPMIVRWEIWLKVSLDMAEELHDQGTEIIFVELTAEEVIAYATTNHVRVTVAGAAVAVAKNDAERGVTRTELDIMRVT